MFKESLGGLGLSNRILRLSNSDLKISNSSIKISLGGLRLCSKKIILRVGGCTSIPGVL